MKKLLTEAQLLEQALEVDWFAKATPTLQYLYKTFAKDPIKFLRQWFPKKTSLSAEEQQKVLAAFKAEATNPKADEMSIRKALRPSFQMYEAVIPFGNILSEELPSWVNDDSGPNRTYTPDNLDDWIKAYGKELSPEAIKSLESIVDEIKR